MKRLWTRWTDFWAVQRQAQTDPEMLAYSRELQKRCAASWRFRFQTMGQGIAAIFKAQFGHGIGLLQCAFGLVPREK